MIRQAHMAQLVSIHVFSLSEGVQIKGRFRAGMASSTWCMARELVRLASPRRRILQTPGAHWAKWLHFRSKFPSQPSEFSLFFFYSPEQCGAVWICGGGGWWWLLRRVLVSAWRKLNTSCEVLFSGLIGFLFRTEPLPRACQCQVRRIHLSFLVTVKAVCFSFDSQMSCTTCCSCICCRTSICHELWKSKCFSLLGLFFFPVKLSWV